MSEFYKRFADDGKAIEVSHIVRAFKRSDGSVWLERLNLEGLPVRELRRDIHHDTVKGDGRNQVLTFDGENYRVIDDSLIQRLYPWARKPTFRMRFTRWWADMFPPKDYNGAEIR